MLLMLSLTVTRAYAESNFELFFTNTEQYENVKVQEVLSTDTIVIENYLKKGERIKLIGVKGIEFEKKKEKIERDQYGFKVRKPASPLTPLEDRAFDFAKELLEGQTVRLEFDSRKKSNKHYTLAYVFLKENDIFVNAEILRQGYAQLTISPPNTKYAKQLREAYREARREKRGLQNQ